MKGEFQFSGKYRYCNYVDNTLVYVKCKLVKLKNLLFPALKAGSLINLKFYKKNRGRKILNPIDKIPRTSICSDFTSEGNKRDLIAILK